MNDRLEQIEARSDYALTHESLTASDYAEMAWESARDVPALLATVREQQAVIDGLRELADVADVNDQQFGDGNGGSLTTEAIRAAITATEGAQ